MPAELARVVARVPLAAAGQLPSERRIRLYQGESADNYFPRTFPIRLGGIFARVLHERTEQAQLLKPGIRLLGHPKQIGIGSTQSGALRRSRCGGITIRRGSAPRRIVPSSVASATAMAEAKTASTVAELCTTAPAKRRRIARAISEGSSLPGSTSTSAAPVGVAIPAAQTARQRWFRRAALSRTSRRPRRIRRTSRRRPPG